MEFWFVYMIAGCIGGFIVGLLSGGIGPIIVATLFITLSKTNIDPGAIMYFAVATSLAIIVLTTTSSMISHYFKGTIDYQALGNYLPSAAIGGILGAMVSTHIPGTYLQTFFAVFLLYQAVIISLKFKETSAPQLSLNKSKTAGISFLCGLLAACTGVCFGLLFIPYIKKHQKSLPKMVGTLSLCNVFVAALSLIPYLFHAPFKITEHAFGYIYLPGFFIIGFCASLYSYVSSHLVTKVSPKLFNQLLALILGMTSLKILFL
jgi:uncharacterized membrane protein YfcA